jgi:hypothetical protein
MSLIVLIYFEGAFLATGFGMKLATSNGVWINTGLMSFWLLET